MEELIRLIIGSDKLGTPELMELSQAVAIKTARPKPIDGSSEIEYSPATILDVIDTELLREMLHLNSVLRNKHYRDLEPEELLVYRIAAIYASFRYSDFFNFRVELISENIDGIPSKSTKLQCWRAVKEMAIIRESSDRKRNNEWIKAERLVGKHYLPPSPPPEVKPIIKRRPRKRKAKA